MDISFGLIIEDDCVFTKNFKEKLDLKLKNFLKIGIFTSNSCPKPGLELKEE